jgi:hypothetical protein
MIHFQDLAVTVARRNNYTGINTHTHKGTEIILKHFMVVKSKLFNSNQG